MKGFAVKAYGMKAPFGTFGRVTSSLGIIK